MNFRNTCSLAKLIPALGLIAAVASPLAVVEYQIPRDQAFPHDPAVGADGIVWYTDQQNSFIGRLDPATGKITDYATPTPASGPHGIVVAPDGGVWYTANRIGKLGRLDPKTGRIEEYALPAGARDPHTPLIRKGIVWFTVQQSNVYGRFDPRTREAKVWTVPTNRALPYGMVNAPDGSIWVALFGTNKLGRIDAESGALREITLPEVERARGVSSSTNPGWCGTAILRAAISAPTTRRTAPSRNGYRPEVPAPHLMASRSLPTDGSSTTKRAPERSSRSTEKRGKWRRSRSLRRALSFGTCQSTAREAESG